MDNFISIYKIFWLIGFSVSVLCVLIQLFLYVILASSRKLDQKILTQLTVARLGNVIVEYFVMGGTSDDPKIRDTVFALYIQTDAALIFWMFVFTKNLYDKVVLVFSLKKISFVLVSVSIWLLTLPIGLLCPLLLSIHDGRGFNTFYFVYGIVKFIILSMNLLFFCRIFWVAISRRPERDFKGLLRTCVVSFILVSITSLQVLLTDLTTFFAKDHEALLSFAFGVVNSYQVLPITIIFVILSKPGTESIRKTIVSKLKGLME